MRTAILEIIAAVNRFAPGIPNITFFPSERGDGAWTTHVSAGIDLLSSATELTIEESLRVAGIGILTMWEQQVNRDSAKLADLVNQYKEK